MAALRINLITVWARLVGGAPELLGYSIDPPTRDTFSEQDLKPY